MRTGTHPRAKQFFICTAAATEQFLLYKTQQMGDGIDVSHIDPGSYALHCHKPEKHKASNAQRKPA